MPLAEARAVVLASGMIIDGHAVLCRSCSGRPVSPESFVITADDMEQFALAVRNKLIIEIAGRTLALGHPITVARE